MRGAPEYAVGLLRACRASEVALRLGKEPSPVLHADGPQRVVGCTEGAVDNAEVGRSLVEHDLVVVVAVRETGRGRSIAAVAPLDVEGAVGGTASGQRKDASSRRNGVLVGLEWEDGVAKRGVGQAATVEVISKGAEAQVAVGAGFGRGVGVAVERDREGQGDERGAVIRVVADVGRAGTMLALELVMT